jgi:integrase/recombinase XerD
MEVYHDNARGDKAVPGLPSAKSQKAHHRELRPLLEKYEAAYSQQVLDSIGSHGIYDFLETVTQHLSKSTRRLRYAQMKAFYNFIIDRCSLNMKNPCNTALLRKSYRAPKQLPHKILEREIVDEMIYCTRRQRDRLILELQARCGLRIGELLKIKVSDISDRTITLREPKSGKDAELAYMPDSVSKKLAEYIKEKGLQSDDRPFPICYSTARTLVRRLGEKVKVRISHHDLRRYSATYASRNGVPLEVVSKIILRHQDLKTTQVYLGKVSDTEAIRWVDILHGK